MCDLPKGIQYWLCQKKFPRNSDSYFLCQTFVYTDTIKDKIFVVLKDYLTKILLLLLLLGNNFLVRCFEGNIFQK